MKLNTKVRYSSPFPNKKKNNELLEKTKSVYFKERNQLVLDIPPQVTKSYMSTNKFYFDNKKWKSIHTKEKKKCKDDINVNIGYVSWVVELDNLEKVLSYKNDNEIKEIVNKELDWKHENSIKLKENKETSLNFHRSISPKRFLDKIIESKYKPFFHKFYGKIPEYLHEFKMREKIEKEYERLVKEEKTYPKNSFKLEEEDRVTILGKLYETQKHLIKILKQFPVSINVSSFSLQNKKSIIDRKIAEVDKIVKIFEMKKVFLKK